MINWKRNDPEKFVFLFHSIDMKDWGATVEVIAAEDVEGNNSYKFTFSECRETRWNNEIEPDELGIKYQAVTVIGFDLGEENYRTEAFLYGGFFDVVFYYKSLQISKL